MTSFLDGGLPAGPGWYQQEYFQNYSTDRLRDKMAGRTCFFSIH
ncbi:lipoprotein [Pseudomonas chlororaphis]|nr:lipoprotein [Pseudomonas chlororaphis]